MQYDLLSGSTGFVGGGGEVYGLWVNKDAANVVDVVLVATGRSKGTRGLVVEMELWIL